MARVTAGQRLRAQVEAIYAAREARVKMRFSPSNMKGEVSHFPMTMKCAESVFDVEVMDGEVSLSVDYAGWAIDFTPDELDALADEFKALAEMAREAV